MLSSVPVLIDDINLVGAGSDPGSNADHGGGSAFVEFKNEVYFAADDGVTGNALWKTDGTQNGTVQVYDIMSGEADPLIEGLTVMGEGEYEALYFIAGHPYSERALWSTTDGTAATIELVAEVNPSAFSMTPVGNQLFFYGKYAGPGLWNYDAVTREVSELDAAASNCVTSSLGESLFFSSRDQDGTYKLMKYQVPTETLVEVAGDLSLPVGNLTVSGTEIYFSSGDKLWITMGATTESPSAAHTWLRFISGFSRIYVDRERTIFYRLQQRYKPICHLED